MVSFTDAQTSPFTLNPGQSYVTSNKCMTKLEALTMFGLEAGFMMTYGPDQLVPKVQWVATELVYTYYGTLYAQNPCDPMVYVYYGSNGQWYSEVSGSYYGITYACQYAYYDPGADTYVYSVYYLEPSNATPVYYGQSTSPCAPF
jgi:hypothetical protein